MGWNRSCPKTNCEAGFLHFGYGLPDKMAKAR